MLTLRCTHRVRRQLRLPERLPEPAPSTGVLGDWYLHLIRFGHRELAMATSEPSLLTLLLPAKGLSASLAPSLRAALTALLEVLEIPWASIAREIGTLDSLTFGRATNRRVLGSMNDLALQTRVCLDRGEDLLTISHHLAQTPLSAIGPKPGHYAYPEDVARALLR